MLGFIKDIIKRVRCICKWGVPSSQNYSITLTRQEWRLLDGIIQTGILNITQERREKYHDQYIDLFDKMNKQFANFNNE